MSESIYLDAARNAFKVSGNDYVEARRRIMRHRDQNSPGTFSHAFHNQVLHALGVLRARGELE